MLTEAELIDLPTGLGTEGCSVLSLPPLTCPIPLSALLSVLKGGEVPSAFCVGSCEWCCVSTQWGHERWSDQVQLARLYDSVPMGLLEPAVRTAVRPCPLVPSRMCCQRLNVRESSRRKSSHYIDRIVHGPWAFTKKYTLNFL